MSIKIATKSFTLLVSFIILTLVLTGCGTTAPVSEPPASTQTALDPAAARGQSLYNNQCKVCHGTNGSGGSGPGLVGKTPSASYIQANMPRNKPNSLNSEQVADLVAYITTLK